MTAPIPLAGTRIVRAGFRRDRIHRRLATLAWLIGLLIAIASVWPAWRWWSDVLALAPAGDGMAQRFDLVVFKEIVQSERASPSGMAASALLGGALLAVLLNPFLSAGVLAVLARPDERIVPRFFAAGAQFYGRYLRAIVYVAVPALVALALVSAGGQALVEAVSDRGLERAGLLVNAIALLATIATAAFFVAVLDVARIRVLLDDSRSVLRAVRTAIGFAARRLGVLVRIGLVFAVSWMALLAGVVGLRAVLPGDGWGWIAVAVLLQQVAAYGRMRLRIAVLAAELALARDSRQPHLSQPLEPSVSG